ncbi:MAG TPA: rRNA maturation RNase YbeY [Geminicoccus sp.]|jgi:probable rRNA maturation factor|uniref:rRNA maturation RNase YbeY n=1 Tax=Geminicoccus sp. TaxID=2024832 RepID=UPI002E303309|nr:rRNA maturation RNase YbeY [Geminicoccus sp.]HEX2526262.1 rRNA maturation RNase YbeY [Geminicoccus sp.]
MNDDSSHPIEVTVEAEAWNTTVTDPIGLVQTTAAQTLIEAAPAHLRNAQVSVLLTDDERIRILNHDWRGKDKPTDVLSFPAYDPDVPVPPGMVPELGDIAVALETVRRDAAAEGRAAEEHLRHMIVHGVLHLLGFDHETGESDALRMERTEAMILARFGIADPYAEAVP